MNHFAKTKRQFKYLSKKINVLISFKKWSKLSFTKRQEYIRRLKKLDLKVQYLIPKRARLKTLGIAAGLIGHVTLSNAQTFGSPQTNPFNLSSNGGFITTTLIDIDNDGDLDLFQGGYDGNILFYQNTGTSTAPIFASPQTNPFGITDVGDLSSPSFIDIDNDGDLDLFSGEGSNSPDLHFFENIGTPTNPSFATVQTNPFGFVKTNYSRHPTFVDIDKDGDVDLFIGGLYGNIHYYENTGTISSPVFANGVLNPMGLTNSTTGIFTPRFLDIDKDGDFDLFSGSYQGDIKFFLNSGDSLSASFDTVQTNPFSLSNSGGFSLSVSLADLDNDGDVDLLGGIHLGAKVYYENTTFSSIKNIVEPIEVNIAPNPASTSISFNYEMKNTTEDIELSILTIMGVEIKKHSLNNHETTTDILIEDLPSGTYFCVLKTSKKLLTIKKFVVIR